MEERRTEERRTVSVNTITYGVGEPVEVITPDETTTVDRIPIRRAGYWVVRYKGNYHQVHGGIRGPLFMGTATGKA